MENTVAAVKNSMVVPQKLNTELPHYPAIPFLDIYSKEIKAGAHTDICTPVFVAALFAVVKR